METIRQQMIALLTDQGMDARGLSSALGIREKEVYDHLSHIKRSLARQNKKLIILPSICLSCDHVFKNRTRFTSPGKCPYCRKTHIQSPSYRIK